MKDCNENILRTLQLAEELLELGQKGDEDREDDGCGVLFGIVRDAGYKIREQADRERKKHKDSRRWN